MTGGCSMAPTSSSGAWPTSSMASAGWRPTPTGGTASTVAWKLAAGPASGSGWPASPSSWWRWSGGLIPLAGRGDADPGGLRPAGLPPTGARPARLRTGRTPTARGRRPRRRTSASSSSTATPAPDCWAPAGWCSSGWCRPVRPTASASATPTCRRRRRPGGAAPRLRALDRQPGLAPGGRDPRPPHRHRRPRRHPRRTWAVDRDGHGRRPCSAHRAGRRHGPAPGGSLDRARPATARSPYTGPDNRTVDLRLTSGGQTRLDDLVVDGWRRPARGGRSPSTASRRSRAPTPTGPRSGRRPGRSCGWCDQAWWPSWSPGASRRGDRGRRWPRSRGRRAEWDDWWPSRGRRTALPTRGRRRPRPRPSRPHQSFLAELCKASLRLVARGRTAGDAAGCDAVAADLHSLRERARPRGLARTATSS